MNKIFEVFKKIPEAYYAWKKRNENLTNFLEDANNQQQQLDRIEGSLMELESNVYELQQQVKTLDDQTTMINNRLEIIGTGTKMELFDTLHNWRIQYVTRGWALPAEKREVEEIWRVYHIELKGNGQGERYYNEIMDLPESEDELKIRSE